MKVSEMIDECLRLACRADLIGGADEGAQQARRTLLHCFNAVSEELARGYFPLTREEQMFSENGMFAFADFAETPVRIVSVTKDGKRVKWRILPQRLQCGADGITVLYEYVPPHCTESDDFAFPSASVGATVVEYGMVSEYLLICGDVQGAAAWESKYRSEIDRLLSMRTVRDRIPPRRWI